MRWFKLSIVGLPLLAVAVLTACKHNAESIVAYEVVLTNLTEAQPFSPPALILHRSGYLAWEVGAAAGNGLEHLAEGGDTSFLLAEAGAYPQVEAVLGGESVVPPGASASLIIEGGAHPDLSLTVASMLVNTNDAFSGLNAEPLHGLPVLGSRSFEVAAYDAGTESNSESVATVPGPAAGGEGFNSARDDHNRVSGHPGVVSAADGLAGSALEAEHRFDNPVARITITRLQ